MCTDSSSLSFIQSPVHRSALLPNRTLSLSQSQCSSHAVLVCFLVTVTVSFVADSPFETCCKLQPANFAHCFRSQLPLAPRLPLSAHPLPPMCSPRSARQRTVNIAVHVISTTHQRPSSFCGCCRWLLPLASSCRRLSFYFSFSIFVPVSVSPWLAILCCGILRIFSSVFSTHFFSTPRCFVSKRTRRTRV